MWLTIKDYADKQNISQPSAYRRLQTGKYKFKRIKGIKHVWYDAEQIEQQQQQQQQEEQKLNLEFSAIQNEQRKLKLDLQKQKLKNLHEDTILKQLKQQSIKEQYRRQFAQGVFECLSESFADVKTLFIELKLDKENNAKLKQSFKKAISKFEQKLIKYLEQKDKQESENETDVEKSN